MMRFASIILCFVTAAAGLVFTVPARAALEDRGGGLVYDNDLNVTWMKSANLAAELELVPDGLIDKAGAVEFVNLVNASIRPWGFDNWRLPITPTATDDGCTQQFNEGFNCTRSELGHLYYVTLRNWQGEGGLVNRGPFRDIQVDFNYWTNWDMTSPGAPPNSITFKFRTGQQIRSEDTERHYVWLVHDGDVGPRPDLVETSLVLNSIDLRARRARVRDTVRNTGAAAAGSSRTGFYLSRHPSYFTLDIPLAGGRLVSQLVQGASSTGMTTVEWPSVIPPGTYAVLACADNRGRVTESDENNNCIASHTFRVRAHGF